MQRQYSRDLGWQLPGQSRLPRSGTHQNFIGETHSNFHAQRMQLEIIKELSRCFPGKVAIGMEMVQYLELQLPAGFTEPAGQALPRRRHFLTSPR